MTSLKMLSSKAFQQRQSQQASWLAELNLFACMPCDLFVLRAPVNHENLNGSLSMPSAQWTGQLNPFGLKRAEGLRAPTGSQLQSGRHCHAHYFGVHTPNRNIKIQVTAVAKEGAGRYYPLQFPTVSSPKMTLHHVDQRQGTCKGACMSQLAPTSALIQRAR